MHIKHRQIGDTRIYCALPILGLETLVLYVEDIEQPLTSSCEFRRDKRIILRNQIQKWENGITLQNSSETKNAVNFIFQNKTNLLN